VVSFAEPARLVLLVLPAVAAVLTVFRHRRRLAQQRRLAAPGVWVRLLGGTPATGFGRMLLWCAAAALIVLATARPQWGEQPSEESVRTRDLVVALDVSDSMLCGDVGPSRLGRSIETLNRLLPLLEGNRLAVVVFSGDAYPLLPLTTDLSAVSVFLEGVAPGMVALPGSNLQRAVEASLELLPEEGEGRVVVIFTDGENLQGDVEAATTSLREAGVGLLGVVVGTEQGGPIPQTDERGGVHYKRDADGQPVVTRAHPEVVAGIADDVDGEVVLLNGPDVVGKIAGAVSTLRTREVTTAARVHRVERFPLFLALAAGLLTLGFALSPWRRTAAAVVALVLLVPALGGAQGTPAASSAPNVPAPPAAREADQEPLPPPPWWQRWIPGGSRRMARTGVAEWKAGDLPDATAAFAGAADLDPEAPERLYDLGTSLAGEGKLAAAQPVLTDASRRGARDAAFNLGTASLQQQQLEPAVEWLRQAVLADPDDVGAKHNYELALRMLEQQQQQQQQQQDQDQQKQDQQDQDQQQPQDQEGAQPTPTPTAAQGAEPTPTPDPNQAVFAALDRAEAEARDALRSPTPAAGKVEKDW
jgi:Ca-activated chloride channel family protein